MMESQSLQKMSLVAQYDDLCRHTTVLTKGCEVEFKTFVESQLNFLHKRNKADLQVKNLNENVTCLKSANEALETKILHLKNLLNETVAARKRIEAEKNTLARQIAIIKDVLLADTGIDNQTKEKLAFLSSSCIPDAKAISPPRLHAIEESVDSLFSPSDVDQTDDDILESKQRRSSRRRNRFSASKRGSSENRESPKKKRLDLCELNTATEQNIGSKMMLACRSNSEPASSSPESLDYAAIAKQVILKSSDLRKVHSCSSTPTNRRVSKTHAFVSKINVMNRLNRLKCYPCGQNIGYLKYSLKCQKCRMVCHMECEEKCPKQCIPLICTPIKGGPGTIADYAPSTSPMVPPLIAHCVNEIESRGLGEVGLYRVPGSEREVKSLKEKFITGRIIPCLSSIDIHAVCGTVKEFLRTLREPLITRDAWKAFIDAADERDISISLELLYGIICVLPMPNRDTLAFLILHLQKIADSPHCKMSTDNLAKVFGPTLIGYSEQIPANANLVKETSQQYQVMHRLLSIPSEKWRNLLSIEFPILQSGAIKTPEKLPPPKVTRLGPLYSRSQNAKSMNVGRTPVTTRSFGYNKPVGRMKFSSPLVK